MSGYIGPAPVPQATQTRETFTATASQTTFATAGYTVGYLDVYLNGVHLVDGEDYTATNGSDVVLSSGAAADDVLEVVAYKPFEVVDQNFTGDFSVDTDTLYVDSANNRVGIGTSSPGEQFVVGGGAKIQLNQGASREAEIYTDSAGNLNLLADHGDLGGGDHIFRNGSTGTELARLLNNGNLGIGTSSPANLLSIHGSQPFLDIQDTRSGSWTGEDVFSGIQFRTSDPDASGAGAVHAFIKSVHTRSGTHANADAGLVFGTSNGTAPAASEAMRIDSSGNLLVGTTTSLFSDENTNIGFTSYPSGTLVSAKTGGSANIYLNKVGAVDGDVAEFYRNGASVGSISVTSSTTSYNTSSDERLKENIADAQPASDLIDGIQVREFDWKVDGEHQRYGMVAQELETVAPEAVTKGETEDDMWSVDYSKLVPMLVKEIQDLRARVAELENTK